MRVAIIGGSGKMGQWFASFLLKEGQEVIITGRNKKKLRDAKRQLGVAIATNAEAVKWSDVVLLSVPIDNFAAVVRELQPYFQPNQIVIDITSIKVLPVAIMHRYVKTAVVLGTHPMFGPGAKDIAKQNFVLTPTNEAETALAQKIKGYVEARGARATLLTPQEHDEIMAVVLGLAHFIGIAAADTLRSFDRLKQMAAIGGSTFKVLLTLAESVMAEDAEFYASLQMNLPGMTEIHELFQKSSKTWADIVKKKDRHQFVQRMMGLKEKLEKSDPDFKKAYENMYKLGER